MRSFHGQFLVGSAVALSLCSGCSSGADIAGPMRTETSGPSGLHGLSLPVMPVLGTPLGVHPVINSAAMTKNKGDTIAISDEINNVVDIFTAAGMQVGQLTGFNGPLGMTSDIKGDLYVADFRNARVQVYAAGFASPPTSLSLSGEYPTDVATFAYGPYVAVTTFGGVFIFKDGTLHNTITVPNQDEPESCAFDASGNLYMISDVGSGYGNRSVIYEIPNATSGRTKLERLATTNRIGYASGIQVTTAGQIAIEDYDNKAIYTYNPPSAGSLGTPTQITPLGGAEDFISFAFTKNMSDLYAAAEDSGTLEYPYPAGGTPLSRFTIKGVAWGTAVIPTQYPKKKSQ